MKKLTFLIAFTLVFFYACNKQETNPTTDIQQVETSDFPAYVLNISDENPVWELVTISDAESNSGSASLKQNNSAHTHGDYYSTNGGTTVSWSGTENNGGPHGSAFLTLGASEVTAETECIMAEGNMAVYGGIITEVINPSGPLAVGSYVFFRVTDNGQGNNADPDQFTNAVLVFPINLCGVANPSWFLWGLFGEADVLAPGSVKVNN